MTYINPIGFQVDMDQIRLLSGALSSSEFVLKGFYYVYSSRFRNFPGQGRS